MTVLLALLGLGLICAVVVGIKLLGIASVEDFDQRE